MHMTIGDLVEEVDERNPPEGAVVFSVSEKLGIVPQSHLFRKQIATDDKSKYRRVQFGDIVYNPYLLWNRAVGVCFDQRGGCVSPAYPVLRPRESGIERFLHYFFRSDQLISAVDAIAAGSVTRRRTAPLVDVLNFVFDLPELAQQRAANVLLSSIDGKIELNRRMNETLESITRAIFKSWFVNFDPVRAKAEGQEPVLPKSLVDLFPDRFEDSGGIPVGWKSGTLAEYAELNPESWSKSTVPREIAYVDLANTKWGKVEGVQRYDWKDAPSRAQRILRPGDTIVGTVRPGNGSFSLIAQPGLTGSTGFAVLRPRKSTYEEYVYLAATSRENIERLSHLADGAAYPAVQPDVVLATVVVQPTESVIQCFSEAVKPLMARAAANWRESDTLGAIRDTLLPKLIAGELQFSDAEQVISETSS